MFPLGKGDALGSNFGMEIIFQVDGERVAGTEARIKGIFPEHAVPYDGGTVIGWLFRLA